MVHEIDRFEVTEVKPLIGAVVKSNKATLLSRSHAQHIRTLLDDRGVIVFAQADFTEDEQVEFTKTLGKFVPEMIGDTFKITTDKNINPLADYTHGAFYWHIDDTMDRATAYPLDCDRLMVRTKLEGEEEFA